MKALNKSFALLCRYHFSTSSTSSSQLYSPLLALKSVTQFARAGPKRSIPKQQPIYNNAAASPSLSNQDPSESQNEETKPFEFTKDTFNKILSVINPETVSAIQNSNLAEQIINSTPSDAETLIACIKVLHVCGMREQVLHEKMLVHALNPQFMQDFNNTTDIDAIINYFIVRTGNKQYMREFEGFFIARMSSLSEDRVRALVYLFCGNYMGSIEFYTAVQDKLVQHVQHEDESQNETRIATIEKDLLSFYMPAFTKANHYTHAMQSRIIQLITDRLTSEKQIKYAQDTIMPYVADLLEFFALKFNETTDLHAKLLSVIRSERERTKTLDKGITKGLGLFLEVQRLLAPRQPVDEMFTPAMRVRHSILRESLTQVEIAKHLRKIHPNVKENYTVDIFNVDFYLEQAKEEQQKQRTVIEVNGRFHYFHNRRSGHYEIKHRCIRQIGYRILEIYDYDWKKLTSDDEKRVFLQKILS